MIGGQSRNEVAEKEIDVCANISVWEIVEKKRKRKRKRKEKEKKGEEREGEKGREKRGGKRRELYDIKYINKKTKVGKWGTEKKEIERNQIGRRYENQGV